jgi:hypothetical protein
MARLQRFVMMPSFPGAVHPGFTFRAPGALGVFHLHANLTFAGPDATNFTHPKQDSNRYFSRNKFSRGAR